MSGGSLRPAPPARGDAERGRDHDATGGATLAPHDQAQLEAGEHAHPHRVLGPHPARMDGVAGVVVRAFHPDATRVEAVLADGEAIALDPVGRAGLFAAFLPGRRLPLGYRLRFRLPAGTAGERGDPYRFPPTVEESDLRLFAEGSHRRLWEHLGAHPRRLDGEDGVAFAVWAPHARRVSVVGEFCDWDGRLLPMRRLEDTGVFELFVPGVAPGALYKYEILTRERTRRLKTDPFALAMECPPGTAARVARSDTYRWSDQAWLEARARRDATREPMIVYEVHAGSWARVEEEGDRPLTYRELAPRLVAHARRFGFTHIELMPVMEHPFGGSWGYQVTGYYAPTARFGSPDDLRFLVDTCHRAGIGVILDWVPAHFPRDEFALARFDGRALFEHEDPRRGEHREWDTLIFNYERPEVVNFLLASALYWLDAFHADGLRIDAVASLLYLDYGREGDDWLPNRDGGRENLEAVAFLRTLTEAARELHPGSVTIAEESTAWPGVTHPVGEGGLGFTFKWNMGWTHDALRYFARDPRERGRHHDELTFAMMYEHSERFVNALSHDEVAPGQGSLLARMPGDLRAKLANLRLLLTYQYTRPGKKLLFMGMELAPPDEWNHDASLDWRLADDPPRRGLARFLADLGGLYHASPCLWRGDPDRASFHWIDCADRENAVISYLRRHGDDQLVVVLNLGPATLASYRIGLPCPGTWIERLCSDDERYGGSGHPDSQRIVAEAVPLHGQAHSAPLRIAALTALVLAPERR